VTLALVLGATGLVMIGVAIRHERQMQKHRQPGVSYRDVTLRLDGAWRRADMFTEQGLKHQRRASAWGFPGLALIIVAIMLAAIGK
jgi:hypothetical protein